MSDVRVELERTRKVEKVFGNTMEHHTVVELDSQGEDRPSHVVDVISRPRHHEYGKTT